MKESSPAQREKNKTSVRRFKIIFSGFMGFLIVFSSYHVYFANKVIPGVKVAGINVGGKTFSEAQDLLQKNLPKKKLLNIVDPENKATHEINLDEADIKYQTEATIKKAFKIGRTGNLLQDNYAKVRALIIPLTHPLDYTINRNLVDQRLNQIKGSVDRPAESAEFYLDDGEFLQVREEKHGIRVDSQVLKTMLEKHLGEADFEPITLPIKPDEPQILRTDLEKIKPQIDPLLEEDLIIRHTNKAWNITPAEKLAFLEVIKEKGHVKPTVNERELAQYQRNLEKDVNVLPRGRVTKETSEGEVEEFELLGKGEELDKSQFEADFKREFFEPSGEVTIETRTTDESEDVSKYGITNLIGYGESNYAGSSTARASNLILAAERASGVMVPPGGVYSLNNAVGPISANTGFNSAWVISSGRTVLGSGGGVCQTSTTLFRAVLDSGLPVVERHAHAYRVGYYEKDRPVGFDAAIYQPALDMRFKNDTENYVLVQAYAVPEETKLVFKIYGTPDGREVQITEPVVTGYAPAPAPLYQETDTLKKGVVEQIDFAASGATSVFSRTVKKEGEILFEETYRSVYRPWQAIFLVGTAD